MFGKNCYRKLGNDRELSEHKLNNVNLNYSEHVVTDDKAALSDTQNETSDSKTAAGKTKCKKNWSDCKTEDSTISFVNPGFGTVVNINRCEEKKQ